jgi:hypothetical protein
MSILKRRSEIEDVEKKANRLVDFCKKSQTNLDTIFYGYFARKEISPGSWGLDKDTLSDNLQIWGNSRAEIEKTLNQLQSSGFLESFKWRNRDVCDFPYRENSEFQSHFLQTLRTSVSFKAKISETEKSIDYYLLSRIKEEKNEEIASILRLLFSTPMPEIGKTLSVGSVAEFHFKHVLGEKWIDTIIELIREKVVLMRLNFLSTNVASEYSIPEYSRSLVSTHLKYANLLLKRTLETLVSYPLFEENFQVSEKNKDQLLKRGLCYRKWTTPKVTITEVYVPTSSLYEVLVEEIPEIPQMIIKTYPDEELWTYYLIGNALINAKQSISISSPYTDQTTLTYFVNSSPKDVEIRILTSHTGGEKKEKKFIEILKKMWIDGYRIELLKILRESKRVPLHDRYLIQDNKVVVDLPGDLKRGFSGCDKAENIKWIPIGDKVIAFNNQFSKLWNLNFSESDFVKDSSAILGTKLSFAKPDLAIIYKVSLIDGKIKKEEKTISLDQFVSQI